MVRTQIQLTEDQAKAIKKIAAAQGVSVAELIRRAVDGAIKSGAKMDMMERQKHDEYLVEAYRK